MDFGVRLHNWVRDDRFAHPDFPGSGPGAANRLADAARSSSCLVERAYRKPGSPLPQQKKVPLSAATMPVNNDPMERSSFQMSLAGLLGLVACVAFNFWLFR